MKSSKINGGSNGRAGKPVPVAPVVSVEVPIPVEVADTSPPPSRVGSTARRMSATECARQCGISRQRVQVLLKQGRSPQEIIASVHQRKQSEQAAAREQKAYRSRQGDGDAGELEPLASSQRRKESALADTRELELAARRGELISFAAAQSFMCSCVIGAREVWMALSDLAPQVRECADDIGGQQLIDAEIRRGLHELERFAGLCRDDMLGRAVPDAPPSVREALRVVLDWSAGSGGAQQAGAKEGGGGGNGNG